MLKNSCILLFLLSFSFSYAGAQQRLDPKGMTYLIAPKPNVIVYHDSVFNGVKEFRSLFYRYRDIELINYVEKHQANKITGQILGVVGTVATIIGVGKLSTDQKGLGWALIGGGFATSITGGYLLLMGQRNLATAVTLFNQRYHRASLGIGVSGNAAGLVYKF
jgi:hypothetical protein